MAFLKEKEAEIIYPESDGLPLAENTIQFRFITTIVGGIAGIYKDDPNVFIAGDLFWFPKEKQPDIKQAPDVMVVFGRPQGDRGS
ncbi:MAG: Uma2 family endonuclease, partial [Okeania sp. SIO3I5]|nr:Uma2 family endonuclease [Okeania sp. SIO3I5]